MKNATYLFLLVIGLGALGALQAGEMEPPGPPGPTMVSLQQIHDKLDECTGGAVCGVQKTGQSDCWNASGTPIDCAGTGQDGEYQTGFSLDPRFTDILDGTVKDSLTGLIWLKDADCFASRNWTQALADANGLSNGSCGLSDGSAAGEWRLPNIRELLSLVSHGKASVGQDSPALPPGHPFFGLNSGSYYWSSTSRSTAPNLALYLVVPTGHTHNNSKFEVYGVWPVRGGR